MKLEIELATNNDIDEIEILYDELNDYLLERENFPGWAKGVYPTRQDAMVGYNADALYVARHEGVIAGTIILNNHPESAYHTVEWGVESDYSDVFVIHTFAVHPRFLKCGVGKVLLEFAVQHGRASSMKALRLDVYEGNIPAIKLYEKWNFKYVGTVDLGLGAWGLDRFRLYERML